MKLKKQHLLIPLVLGLGAAVAWRVQAQDAYKRAPSGGSTTVEGTETTAASKTGGRLVEVLVHEGDVVQPGQAIARLDCVDAEAAVATAQAQVDNARAQQVLAEAGQKGANAQAAAARAQAAATARQIASAKVLEEQAAREEERMAKLAAANAIEGKAVDDVMYAARTAKERREAAQAAATAAQRQASAAATQAGAEGARIEVARTAVSIAETQLARARLAVAECAIAAPTGGTVTARLHEPGAVIAPGMPVVTILDTRVVTATFFLPDAELGRVKPGMKAQLKVDAYGAQVFEGTVRRIAAEAEFTPRNVQTREDRDRLVYAVDVDVPNPEGNLRAGMPGEITIPGTER
jgi:HlyD family secretion protein